MGTILITGASGFIGSYLVEEGIRQDYRVYAGIRKSSSLVHLKNKSVNLLTLDLSNKDSLKKTWLRLKSEDITFDYIIHNAGLTCGKNATEYDIVNYRYTHNLYDSLLEAYFQPKKFVLVSSLAAIGPGDPISLNPILPNQKAQPLTPYGHSKLKAERFIKSSFHLPYLIFRPTGVYGPRDKDYLQFFKTISNHFEPYLGSPEQQLSFIYVKDLARLVVNSLASKTVDKAYNVSDGQVYTCRYFAELIKNELHKKTVKIRFPKVVLHLISLILTGMSKLNGKPALINKDKIKELTALNWSCDASDLQKDFQFEAKYKLENGVKEVIQWYKRNQLL